MILLRVSELHVADRSGRLLHLSGNAFIALTAESNGPLDLLAFAEGPCPRRTHRTQVIAEDVSSAASVRAVDDEDIGIWKTHPAVLCDNPRIIPLGDLPLKNTRDDIAGQIERLLEIGNVVRDDDGAHDCREVENRAALGVRELLIR